MPSHRLPTTGPRTVLLAVLLLAGPALAGCVGADDGGATEPAATDPGTSPEGGGGPGVGPAATGFEAGPTWDVLWRNGTFASHDVAAAQQAPAAASGADRRTVDAAEIVPRGVPVTLNATITWDPGPGGPPASFDVFPAAGPIYQFDMGGDDSQGRAWAQWTTARFEDEVPVLVDADQPNADAETPYTLRVTAHARPGAVPFDVPVAVDVPDGAAAVELAPVPANASTGADAAEGAGLAARAWSPGDAFLGQWSAELGEPLRIPLNASGEHVLLLNRRPAQVRLVGADGATLAPAAPLRPLDMEAAWGEARDLPAGGSPATWTLETDRVPLSTALALEPGDEPVQRGLPPGTSRLTVTSEAGTVFDVTAGCGPLCKSFIVRNGGQYVFRVFSDLGDRNLTTTSYDVTVTYERGAHNQVRAGAFHYVR